MMLSISHAQEIQTADDPQLFNVVEELTIAGGMPMPKIYVIDDTAMNAFSTKPSLLAGRKLALGVLAAMAFATAAQAGVTFSGS